jgi:hypothetical protein
VLGGMGPYEEPKNDGGKLFEGLYATPILLRVMHHFHLPDADSEKGAPPRRSKRPSGAQQ